MHIYDLIFYLFATISILSAFLVISSKNIVHSAFYLLFTLFGVAGLYVLLAADFIAIVQLFVYVGGILILLLFGVMLTNKVTNIEIKSEPFKLIPAVITIGIFSGALLYAVVNASWKTITPKSNSPTTKILGTLLLQEYLLIFELLGIILLVALIGAASIARK